MSMSGTPWPALRGVSDVFDIKIHLDTEKLTKAILQSVAPDVRRKALVAAGTRMAQKARAEVTRELPKIFDRPTAFTMRSIRYRPPTEHNLTAEVYISDDSNRGLSPRKYLGPEITGGARNAKRSERAMMLKGMIGPDQRWVPSNQSNTDLDVYGNISGSMMVQILSRISAFGEQGYKANASDATKRRLAKLKLAIKSTGTDYFIARNKGDDRALGIWTLQTPGSKGVRGVVRPVLIFVNRQPTYRARFPFGELVEKSFGAHFMDELRAALIAGKW
jgi:hypothetical protein